MKKDLKMRFLANPKHTGDDCEVTYRLELEQISAPTTTPRARSRCSSTKEY